MDKASELDKVAAEYWDAYQKTGALLDLELFVTQSREAVKLTPEIHPNREVRLQSLAVGLLDRYKQTKSADDLQSALELGVEALNITPDRSSTLRSLAVGHRDRFRRDGKPSDIDASVQFISKAIRLTPITQDRANLFLDLGIGYRDRFWFNGVINDLELSIQNCEKAVELSTNNHINRASHLSDLALAYRDRCTQTGSLSDLEHAVRLGREAIEISPQKPLDRALQFQNLAAIYNTRCDLVNAPDDIESWIEYSQQALELTPNDHIDRALRLQKFALAHYYRHVETAKVADLEFFIQHTEEAVKLTGNHVDQGVLYQNCALGYRGRYQKYGGLSDIDHAIQLSKKSIALTSPNHPERGRRWHNFAALFSDRHRRGKLPEDMNTYIEYAERALSCTPAGHPQRHLRYEILAAAYFDRHQKWGEMSDCETSIEYAQKAYNLSPVGHPGRIREIQTLAASFHLRYWRTGTLEDLEPYIRYSRETLELTPEDSPQRANRLQNLAIGYHNRYYVAKSLDDLELSIQFFQKALDHEHSSALVRLRAGRMLFKVHAMAENWLLAYNTACSVGRLISLLTSHSLERSDLQNQVNEIVGLASDGTFAALKAGKKVHQAIEFLELGRGIIAGSLDDMRIDLSDLSKEQPESAKEFTRLRELHNDEGGENSRHDTGKQLDELIERIRNFPGFERFRLAPSEEEMMNATVDGPIIIVNVSEYGCHALIIKNEGLHALELPHLNVKDIKSKASELTNPNTEMLEWLWDTVAHPVLKFLGFGYTQEDIPPRVWWILTGPLAQFPIHVAGRYTDDEMVDTALNWVVSSFSSSVKALINARRSHPTPSSQTNSMVLVGVESTPGHARLPNTPEEIRVLADLGKSIHLQVKQPAPIVKSVVSDLRGCKIFHFAGHGHSDSSDPSKSALILHDGKLTVERIFDVDLSQDQPFLAYLSACGTGQVGNEGLIDEGLHLIGAYQLAGFRHVIGTLWQVNDESCVDIAKITYGWMSRRDLRDSSVSEGLHHACRELRNRWWQSKKRPTQVRNIQLNNNGGASLNQEPSRSDLSGVRDSRDIRSSKEPRLYWVPYVHFGS